MQLCVSWDIVAGENSNSTRKCCHVMAKTNVVYQLNMYTIVMCMCKCQFSNHLPRLVVDFNLNCEFPGRMRWKLSTTIAISVSSTSEAIQFR